MVERVTQIQSKEVLETHSNEYTVKIKGVFFVFSTNQQGGSVLLSTNRSDIADGPFWKFRWTQWKKCYHIHKEKRMKDSPSKIHRLFYHYCVRRSVGRNGCAIGVNISNEYEKDDPDNIDAVI